MTEPARSPTWARVGLLLILLFDVLWRCHTIGPTLEELLDQVIFRHPHTTEEKGVRECFPRKDRDV